MSEADLEYVSGGTYDPRILMESEPLAVAKKKKPAKK
jgi:hypothetical protein